VSAAAGGRAPTPAVALRVLTADAVRDAMRRRIVGFMVVLSLLSLLFVDSCTSCAGGSFQVNGREVDASAVLGVTGVVLYATMLLWTVVLAGVLASDHLTQTLEDGSAALVLARPVGRGVFALARLFGSLVISLGTGGVLLGATAAFLAARYGLSPTPALWGMAAAVPAAVAFGALAMTASLWLPRLACFVLVLLAVAAVSGANLAAALGAELGGFWAALDRFGPPLGTALALVATGWTGHAIDASPTHVAARLALWAVFAAALLAVAFRRRELTG
jgi:ABC-type transport system involved in multi-copper enzyme maturation permease subunit